MKFSQVNLSIIKPVGGDGIKYMIHHLIVIVAIVAQVAAILVILRLISGNVRNLAIVLVIGAALLMLFQRAGTWFYLIQDSPAKIPDKIYHLADIIISIAFFSGIYLIYIKFKKIKLTAQSLYNSEERYALAAEGAQDGLWDWNLAEGKLYLSSRWLGMLGYKNTGDNHKIDVWFRLVHPNDLNNLKKSLLVAKPDGQRYVEHEYRILDNFGTYRWVLCRGVVVTDKSGKPIRIAGSQTDITTRKLNEIRLQHDASHDVLTGLPNRQLFKNRLSRLVENSQKENRFNYAVLFIDLDGFKNINDTYGHVLGDQFLQEAARRLTTCVRPGDMLARIGGDEFIILLDNLPGADHSLAAAARILRKLQTPFELLNHQSSISASIGIAAGDVKLDADQLIHNADMAMYNAKSLGKNRFIAYESISERRKLVLAGVHTTTDYSPINTPIKGNRQEQSVSIH